MADDILARPQTSPKKISRETLTRSLRDSVELSCRDLAFLSRQSRQDTVSAADSSSNFRKGSTRSKVAGTCQYRMGAVAVSTIHKAKQHAKRQAALIIIAYLAFWSPYNVLTVVNFLMPSEGTTIPVKLSFLNAVICANSIINPIIYGVFRTYRK
ncbi:unnamed protein product [Caenorhabditis auriculariae]|uniref:G-protein coupled receptors family 1 profile domain-containing protein n=1 Tax=Caenorhabditis auriculariae TaxID=2777116 RepID=A0A8S1HB22_9PELO|nr:unnamed protein product [Caenorhabditis auriculariae]